MNYRYTKEKCSCGGTFKLVELIQDDVEKILLICKECSLHKIISTPFSSLDKSSYTYDFPVILIERYGVTGLDTNTYLSLINNRDKIFVFGDNLIGQGKGGQAVIRDEVNAFGVPTKRLPSMNEDSFFSDKEDEREAVLGALRKLYKLSIEGHTIVFPKDGLGTGLAEMDKRSPELFKEMNEIIEKFWDIRFVEKKEMIQNSLF